MQTLQIYWQLYSLNDCFKGQISTQVRRLPSRTMAAASVPLFRPAALLK